MLAVTKEATIVHRHPTGAKEREELLRRYLPSSSSSSSRTNSPARKKGRKHRRTSIRSFLKTQIHFVIYTLIHTFFSLYIRLRQAYHAVIDRVFAILYYHHHAPELIARDVRSLSRIPRHLSVILSLEDGERDGIGLEKLMSEVGELAAWSSCAGIKTLSVYEKTGILKSYLPTLHHSVLATLHAYHGSKVPSPTIHAPHTASYPIDAGPSSSSSSTAKGESSSSFPPEINIHLLSLTDGTSTLTDLTKTLTTLSQSNKLLPSQISSTLLSTEIDESLGCSEPDLVIVFEPRIRLQGYPCWQLRLAEIFHVEDNVGVGYQVWLRALYRYSKVEMRFGR